MGAPLVALGFALFSPAWLACEGCRGTSSPAPATHTTAPAQPTLRIYMLSDVAGALEPCGCVKDQLGGLDHAAAWIVAERSKAPASVLVSAGPLFFQDPKLDADHASQYRTKAETLATSLKGLGFAAFAPAENDWAAGAAQATELTRLSGAAMLPSGGVVREVGGVKVAFVGLAEHAGAVGEGHDAGGTDGERPDRSAVIKRAIGEAKGEGAKVFIALVAEGRGAAKRIADDVPELTAILVGSPGGRGDTNTPTPPAERVGNVIIAETGNHLQVVGVLDLYVRDGSYSFADATGLELSQKRADLTRRIDELHVKIAAWEPDGTIAKQDLDARRAELAKLEAERDGLDVRPPPSEGSFFRYTVKEVRDSLGNEPGTHAHLLAYYKTVNDRNRTLFKDRLPRPHTAAEPVYIGVEACSSCHEEARAVWDKSRHSHAYESLSKQSKEFNLDCVSCHVTGYDRPGGSTVTHVDRLTDVQCEVCHGPGSKHALSPSKVKTLVSKPTTNVCLGCHHPPHVEGFDAKAKMQEILGPGHGKPM